MASRNVEGDAKGEDLAMKEERTEERKEEIKIQAELVAFRRFIEKTIGFGNLWTYGAMVHWHEVALVLLHFFRHDQVREIESLVMPSPNIHHVQICSLGCIAHAVLEICYKKTDPSQRDFYLLPSNILRLPPSRVKDIAIVCFVLAKSASTFTILTPSITHNNNKPIDQVIQETPIIDRTGAHWTSMNKLHDAVCAWWADRLKLEDKLFEGTYDAAFRRLANSGPVNGFGVREQPDLKSHYETIKEFIPCLAQLSNFEAMAITRRDLGERACRVLAAVRRDLSFRYSASSSSSLPSAMGSDLLRRIMQLRSDYEISTPATLSRNNNQIPNGSRKRKAELRMLDRQNANLDTTATMKSTHEKSTYELLKQHGQMTTRSKVLHSAATAIVLNAISTATAIRPPKRARFA